LPDGSPVADGKRTIRGTDEVDAVYMLFLGRAAESDTARQDNRDKSVLDVADQMIGSAEFREAVVEPFLGHGALPHDRLSAESLRRVAEFAADTGLADITAADFSPQTYYLAELAPLDGEAFVREAYRAILLRDPDPEGERCYLGLLRDRAASKPAIIAEIVASDEYRQLAGSSPVTWRHDLSGPDLWPDTAAASRFGWRGMLHRMFACAPAHELLERHYGLAAEQLVARLRPAHPELMLHIRAPGWRGIPEPIPVRDRLWVAGWALARDGVAAIEIRAGERELGPVFQALPSAGAAVFYPDCGDAGRSGFAAMIPAADLPREARVVRVVLRDAAGREAATELFIERAEEDGPPSAAQTAFYRRLLDELEWRPCFCLFTALAADDEAAVAGVRASLAALRQQLYPDWRLLVVPRDRAANADALLARLAEGLPAFDHRVAVVAAEGSRRLAEIARRHARGRPPLCAALAPGDAPSLDALFEIAAASAVDPEAELITGGGDQGGPGRGWATIQLLDQIAATLEDVRDPRLPRRWAEPAAGTHKIPLVPRRQDNRRGGSESGELAASIRTIRESGLFDEAYYRERNPHIDGCDIDPVRHYIQHGAAEGRDPHPLFDGEWYLATNPDVAAAGQNPLLHYVTAGVSEGRRGRPADQHSEECAVLEIPYEIWRSPPSLADRDVCLFVTYSPNGQIWDHVVRYINSFIAEQFAVVLVIATDGIDGELHSDLDRVDGILVRANHGWDFAAWAAALAIFPDLWTARRLILANDSLYGPFTSAGFKALVHRIRCSKANVVGLTDSYEICHHIQSYFIALDKSALLCPAVRQFWANVKSILDKDRVIWFYEAAFLGHLRTNNVACEVLFPTNRDGVRELLNNPLLCDWRELVDQGFPFIKIHMIRDRPPECDPAGWEDRIADPQLLHEIHSHLETFGRAGAALIKLQPPIPSPRRRFKRNLSLRTPYGATPACRPTDATDLALEVPFRYPLGGNKEGGIRRVAVIAHIFYPDLAAQLLDYVSNIPVSADLFVSTDQPEKKSAIEEAFHSYNNGTVRVDCFPNRGRDLAAMLVGYADVLEDYDVILHIHSKTSPHDSRMAGWREFLLGNLLGSTDIVRSILDVFDRTDVGVIFSQHFPAVRGILNFGMDFKLMSGLLERSGIRLTRDLVLEFPSGSFFWAKSAALRPLMDMRLGWSDFPEEPLPVDGTLAHAIERSLLYFCEAKGLRWAKVAGDAGDVGADTLVPVCRQSDIDTAVARVHYWITENLVPPMRTGLTEIASIPTRPDPGHRPRLNLIVPGLWPESFFGGLTTAVSLFEELQEHLGEAFDYRIISCARVDLPAMLRFSGYRLLPVGGIFDQFPKTIIDASDAEVGELSLRRGDVFVATAWWTAVTAYELQAAQARRHGHSHPIVYLIQDHEPLFYPSSPRYMTAQQTYTCLAEKIAIINSEELTEFMLNSYRLSDVYTLPFTMNPIIRQAIEPASREPIIVVYGRPEVPRNCFETIVQALALWQRSDPEEAVRWQIVSAGEAYSADRAFGVKNLTVAGKLPLEEYGSLLGRASVGISLMLSPHPSYPPLEMAFAGLITITNTFENKDLTRRSPNIISVSEVAAQAVADALSTAIHRANSFVGTLRGTAEISGLTNCGRTFDPTQFAARLSAMVCNV
jgi:lipopolysaccharide biosynthesis protein